VIIGVRWRRDDRARPADLTGEFTILNAKANSLLQGTGLGRVGRVGALGCVAPVKDAASERTSGAPTCGAPMELASYSNDGIYAASRSAASSGDSAELLQRALLQLRRTLG